MLLIVTLINYLITDSHNYKPDMSHPCTTHRYDLRVQGMLLQLEFPERKNELEPALKVFHDAVDGEPLC